MTYPPPLPFAEFIRRLKADYGVTEKVAKGRLVGPDENPVISLERVVGGKSLRIPKPAIEGDDLITDPMMSYICRRLKLNKSDFGYILEG